MHHVVSLMNSCSRNELVSKTCSALGILSQHCAAFCQTPTYAQTFKSPKQPFSDFIWLLRVYFQMSVYTKRNTEPFMHRMYTNVYFCSFKHGSNCLNLHAGVPATDLIVSIGAPLLRIIELHLLSHFQTQREASNKSKSEDGTHKTVRSSSLKTNGDFYDS